MVQGRAAGDARGVTLIELLVTLTVAAILLAGLVPAFHHIEQRHRAAGAARQFLSALALTRQAAIESAMRVTLCPSANGRTCLPRGTWHRGWLAFRDTDRDREHDAGESVVFRHGSLAAVTLTSSKWRRRITFKPLGTAGGSNGTFTLCSPGAAPRAVILSWIGRARLAETKPGGGVLNCPESP